VDVIKEPIVLLIPARRMSGLGVIGGVGAALSRQPGPPAEARHER
jgi:hypothetical protein